ncbi:hypothetical protein OROMI_003890 [Orobanche minor]
MYVHFGGVETTRRREAAKRRRGLIRAMEWWHKVVFPVRRVWCAVSGRVKSRKNVHEIFLAIFLGAGLLKLHDDIQTCGYEDVRIMWEMLRMESSTHTKRKNRTFWRILA